MPSSPNQLSLCRISQPQYWLAPLTPTPAAGGQGVGEMAAVLTKRLQAPATGLSAATEAISALLQLQADGATSCQGLDPVNLYITTLVRMHGTHAQQLLAP